MGDPSVVGSPVTREHQPVGARVRAVQYPEAVRLRLDLDKRPDHPIHSGKRAEALHDFGVGLVDQLAGECAVAGHVEVAVGEQHWQLVRRALWERDLTFPVVTHDPQAGETGVHAESGHAHDVVVVPEQRRALVVRVGVDGLLTGGVNVLRPAVARSGGDPTVEVHNRIAGERGRGRIRLASAQARPALDRHAIGLVRGRDGDQDGHPQRQARLHGAGILRGCAGRSPCGRLCARRDAA